MVFAFLAILVDVGKVIPRIGKVVVFWTITHAELAITEIGSETVSLLVIGYVHDIRNTYQEEISASQLAIVSLFQKICAVKEYKSQTADVTVVM